MIRFARLPISRKLTLISALTIALALLVSSGAFLAYDRASVQEMIARRLHSQAEIVAFNSATALVFGDPESAVRTLGGLASDAHVLTARIHSADGGLFAEYVRGDQRSAPAAGSPAAALGVTEVFERDELVVTRPILFEGKRLGTLVVRSDLLERDERFRTYAAIVALVFFLALGIALTFGRAAQRSISEPILELVGAAHRIAEQSDFSVRPKSRSEDEVGALVAAFNQMLDGLQKRDDELRVTHAELERRISEADEANRMKDEFLATLSHELRTPLNAILGWAQILRRGGLDAAAVDQALETISRNALTQGQIVADILDMQRITAGKLRLNLQALDLGPIVRRSIDTVNPAARAKEIEIQAVMDAGVGPVLGDEDRLQQVMWNLLANAVKFTPKGGRVRVELVKINSHLELTVEDTGPGLDPEFIPFAFDRFRQADSSSTRRHGGLGLGLAIVRNLVELHGGSVAAGNRSVGTGALFVVRLPRMSVRPAQYSLTGEGRHPDTERQIALETAPSLHGLRVLVVDDELDSREITAAALGRCGADVSSAGSAQEALAFLKRSRPHVILSDIEMPEEDGYSLMRRIRLLPPEEGGMIPAAALTAYAGTEDRMRALAAGFQIHVPKPVQPAELAAVVASLARGPAR
jgi:signal transduction histidine kinase/ActR/RegA family two-component response regulator